MLMALIFWYLFLPQRILIADFPVSTTKDVKVVPYGTKVESKTAKTLSPADVIAATTAAKAYLVAYNASSGAGQADGRSWLPSIRPYVIPALLSKMDIASTRAGNHDGVSTFATAHRLGLSMVTTSSCKSSGVPTVDTRDLSCTYSVTTVDAFGAAYDTSKITPRWPYSTARKDRKVALVRVGDSWRVAATS